ncbi:DDHD domain-containing protein [Peziza echinospora]|nr:DDHD domain-containing protein [Peziza echinospora]
MPSPDIPPPPQLSPWWFYTSPLPLDDPLSPLPITTSATSATKHPPQPFSIYDTKALEKTYQSLLISDEISASQQPIQEPPSIVNTTSKPQQGTKITSTRPHTHTHVRHHHTVTQQKEYAEEGRGHDVLNAPIQRPGIISSAHSPPSITTDNRRRRRSSSPEINPWTGNPIPSRTSDYSTADSSPAGVTMNPPLITSNPFIRSLSSSRGNVSRSPSPSINGTLKKRHKASSMSSLSSLGDTPEAEMPPVVPPVKQLEIPVGIQRLHKVLLPSLTMAPIYWSPLHDISGVCRATWFYRDTMLPVETDMANRLERGYCEVRAWTEEWDAELESAVQVGREGEEKVRWKLWDMGLNTGTNTPMDVSRPSTSSGRTAPMDIAKSRSPILTSNSAGMSASAIPNPNDWVIFANAREAYICRDTMLGFGNRRPLATIRGAGNNANVNVGIRVVRGFDVAEWERLNPKRKITGAKPATTKPAEEEPDGRQEISDLILVIHGIGQKLSERVESFHFTHAINSFRRSMNTELRDPAVKPQLRDDSKGIMVLPINWRSGLSFEDGISSPMSSSNAQKKKPNNYTLESITLKTIPAVRNLIGDVMLDIPYYLSHQHKGRMIDAVVREANRVYGLWITHNPGWEEKGGRVHLIAHSLGSAIALDVLSNQPTRIAEWRREKELGDRERSQDTTTHDHPEDRYFDFDTTNLFCAGSPAGFFLLLNRAMLLPRRGRNKPDIPTGLDTDPNIVGERGTYGCLSVDNIYNVMHYSDPIAYRLNPTVDAEYADNLKIQPIPSATTTLFESIGSTLRSVLPGSAPVPANSQSPDALPLARPMPNLARLPSTIELETHDFSREDIAEKRIYLLNENGTMDWYVGSSGGWVLENQYVNMLGAHSSYWESKDFARFIVGEAGRPVGRKGIREGVRVVKHRGAQ